MERRRHRLPLRNVVGDHTGRCLSRGENLTYRRKEAILLEGGRCDLESFPFRENVSPNHLLHVDGNHPIDIHDQTANNDDDDDYDDDHHHRKRTILLFPENETVSVTSAAGSVTSSSSQFDEDDEEEDEARIRMCSSLRPSSSSSTKDPSSRRHWKMNLDEDEEDVPHDEFVQDTFPDQEWKGRCVAPNDLVEDDHDKEEEDRLLIVTSFVEEEMSRTRRCSNSSSRGQEDSSSPLRFSGTPLKALHTTTTTTTKSSNISVVTPQTVSTAGSTTALEDLDALEDIFGCASPEDFIQSVTDLAYEFTNNNHTGGEFPSTDDCHEGHSVSRNSHDDDDNDDDDDDPAVSEVFDYFNFDFECAKNPSGEDSQQSSSNNNNNQGMEILTTDVHAKPIHPTLKITDKVEIPPLSDLCKAGGCITRLFPPSSSDRALETNTVDDTTKAHLTVIPTNGKLEPESVENNLPKPKRRQVNRTVRQFLQNPRAEQRLNLYVDQYSTSMFDRIVENLYGNSALKTIKLSRGPASMTPSESPRPFQDMLFLLEAIRCLPHLKTLIVSSLNAFLLPALVENLPNSLVTLDLQVLDETIPVDMLDKLVLKNNLTHLQLEVQGSLDIGRLVKSGSQIKSLKVMGTSCTMDCVHFQFFADTLFKNRECPLQLLDLQPTMNLPEWKALTACLRFNPHIQTLRVNVVGATVEEQDDVALDLANFLRVNTTLTSLFNYSHDRVIVSGETLSGSFLEALQANTTLRKLRFFQEDPLFWVAKDAILNRNTNHGEYGQVFYTPYASLAAMLPSIKSRLCGQS